MRRALLVACLCAAPAIAQQEPTPFWLPPPPPKKAPVKPGKAAKPAKKKKPVQLEPLEMKKPPPVVQKPPAEPTWIEPPRAAEPAPAPLEKRAPAEVAPSPAPQIHAPAPPPAAFVPPEPVPPAVVDELEPEPVPAVPDFRRWSGGLTVGAWAKSRGGGGPRAWDLAYGARFGFALNPGIELELQLVRAGGAAGSPFVSAQATHNLAAARAFWVVGNRIALLLGAGGGVALAQTHYTLLPSTDPGVVPNGLDANAVKAVIEITAAFRARIFRGLEARAEVSAMARDGRLEPLPLFGLGAAF